MGADVHYVDPEKGNSPLHVAAKEGQAMQVELLYIYGADPLLCNAADLTPAQLARQDGFVDLANRLDELSFDLTNRLSLFLCGRKPDHQHQQHFLIPELTAKNTVETLRSVRLKIQALPDCAFEKLLQDVYDEVIKIICTLSYHFFCIDWCFREILPIFEIFFYFPLILSNDVICETFDRTNE
ncbi:ankyrin repeat protein [Ancylostoma duodenale]|uniref:Ankyrin repeat protein n=1 Tax=Ancylostoma duodenale TaxID=51022 RepID=A0A0C2H0G9_9BILA|nr:ankyrin repeat protein [Ancylostoma duodenale]